MHPLYKEILQKNRLALAQGITLIESTRPQDREQAEDLLEALLPHTGQSFRVGVSGIPGVGKSSFIEGFGTYCLEQDPELELAVLSIDPTSPLRGGSILADKTRMEELAQHPRVYIRPSASRNMGGGISRRTREVILLLEAFGFPLIFVESVGVGQAEQELAYLVDLFLLLHMPATGDDLQSIKRGILELAQIHVVNKHDGPLRVQAQTLAHYLKSSLSQIATLGALPASLHLCSSKEKTGFAEILQSLNNHRTQSLNSGSLSQRRGTQIRKALMDELVLEFQDLIQRDPAWAYKINQVLGQAPTQPLSRLARQLITPEPSALPG